VRVRLTDPVPLLIVNDPLVAPSLKSLLLTVPEVLLIVQYNVVPSETYVVLTVKVTVDPSFMEVDDCPTA
jgi:hypothetical protein